MLTTSLLYLTLSLLISMLTRPLFPIHCTYFSFSSLILKRSPLPPLTLHLRLPLTVFLQADYVQPVVAVQLLLAKEDFNVEQTVECKVEGSNLRNNDERDKFMGRVTFRVTVSE